MRAMLHTIKSLRGRNARNESLQGVLTAYHTYKESTMDWQQETLRKLREAHRCNNELRYRISDVKILLYEFEEYDAEHALLVGAMNTLNRLRKVLFGLERKLCAARIHAHMKGE